MKKSLLVLLIAITSSTTMNAQSRWNMTIHTSGTTNVSRFDSGAETANALFSNQTYHSAQLGLNFGYKLSEKFSLQTGLTFTEFGFSYSMSKDYSLEKPFERYTNISSATTIASVPVLLLVRTPLNCNNMRFVFGAGATLRGINGNWSDYQTDEISSEEGANQRTTVMTASSEATSTISPALTWQIGFEKVFRKGNSLTFAYTGNQGLTTIAESTVTYTAANKNYTHTFINRGSFVNFSLSYNFLPFGTKKALKAAN